MTAPQVRVKGCQTVQYIGQNFTFLLSYCFIWARQYAHVLVGQTNYTLFKNKWSIKKNSHLEKYILLNIPLENLEQCVTVIKATITHTTPYLLMHPHQHSWIQSNTWPLPVPCNCGPFSMAHYCSVLVTLSVEYSHFLIGFKLGNGVLYIDRALFLT